MIRPGPWRSQVQATERQREVARVLAEETGERLADTLVRLGTVFTCFGLYLASRPDLLPAGECLELAGLPDRGEPLPAAAVLELLGVAWGRPALEVLAGFEEGPRQSRLLTQEHRARLASGEAVVVRVLRPGLEGEAERDLPLLGSVRGAPAEAVTDFREAWPAGLDLDAQAGGMEALAQDAEDAGVLRVPRVHRGLSSSRVLVFEDLGGMPLGGAGGSGEPVRRLCLAWLRQALQGRAIPVEPRDAYVEVLPGDHLVFVGGPMARVPAASQANFWSYLVAAVRRDPDEVCDRLLREMTREEPSASEERLRLRLRQAVPFRDGGWNLSGESLAEHLFLHWRFARECGFRPRVHLLAFWRGLAAVAATARRLAPDRDALLHGLEELRFTSSVSQVGEMLAADRLLESFERYAVLMSGLPERMDEALTAAAEGGRWRSDATPPAERRPRSPLPLAAVLLALAAVALLARQLGGVWDGRTGALLFFGAGAFLLWWMGRT